MKNSNVSLWVGVLIAIVIATASLFFHTGGPVQDVPKAGSSVNGGNVTDYTAVNTTAGYWVNSSKIIGSTGILSSLIAYFDAGLIHSYTNATSSVTTTQTLAAADIANYESVIFTPNTGATTLTLPASSTLSAFVPTAGDWADQCWLNATSTAGVNITFAAGTGIDLETSSTTLVLRPGNTACIKFVRKAATASAFDIAALLTVYVDGD
jgi:hypothetical protein